MYTKFACSIGSGGNNSTLISFAADYYGFVLERRVEKLLDRHEERVHIDVADKAVHECGFQVNLSEWLRSPGVIPLDQILLQCRSRLVIASRELVQGIDIPAPSIDDRHA
jgi:hypothetical protein